GAPIRIVETVVDINERRKVQMSEKVIAACGGSVDGKTIAILGLTFKPNTDDMRDSPSLVVIPELQKAGAAIRAYDPQGMKEARELMGEVTYCEGPYETMEGADALVIVTEWNAFRALDLKRVKSLLSAPIMVDFRNIYNVEELREAGFTYYSIGRSPVIAGPLN
ncbi:MAG: UDPglucose 6-dehydrogenase, partial [Alphaproteobacteria bacterium]